MRRADCKVFSSLVKPDYLIMMTDTSIEDQNDDHIRP